jgi:hypothetical protein
MIKTLTSASLWWSAAARNVYMFVGGAGFFFALLGLTSGDQSQLLAAAKQIGDGVSSIIAGITTIVLVGGPLIAKFKSSPAQVVKTIGSGAVPGISVNVDSTAPAEVQAVAKSDVPNVNMVANATPKGT